VVPILLIVAIFLGNSVRERLAARAAPTLPARTPAEVADWAASPHPQPRSGFFDLSTNLGLGDFGTANGESGGSFVGLAAGTNRARVWEAGDGRRRIALLAPLQETDWYREGDTTYVWHSNDVRVTKVDTPSVTTEPSDGLITLLAGGGTVETPDALAARLLPLRQDSTRLVLHEPSRVAGRPVYELGLIPDSKTSLVTEVAISVDAETGLPLRVTVETRGGTVAIRNEFTALTLRRPADSHFTFRPPSEARVADGATVATSPDVFDDWRKQHQREEAIQDVQSVAGVNRSLVRLATGGQGWDEVVMLSGFRPWRLEQLGRTGETVTGPFGTGQLVRTPVFNLLILSNGSIVAGAVTPAGLEAAAAQGAVGQ
jgi:outer membrane lipoprotein-sorting protein